jgi:hypothetical protein
VDDPEKFQGIRTNLSQALVGNPLKEETNCAEIFTDALITKNQKYGHRAWACKDEADGQRYVLDPFTYKNESKILLSRYQEKRKIQTAVFYKGKPATSDISKFDIK